MNITTNVVSSNPAQARCSRYNIMWIAAGRRVSPVFSTNKTDRHDIAEILLKVALNNINSPLSVNLHQMNALKH